MPDGQRREAADPVRRERGERPADRRSPVVPDDVRGRHAPAGPARRAGRRRAAPTSYDAGPVGRPEAAQVGRDRPEAGRGQRRHLVPPQLVRVREAVQQQHRRPGAGRRTPPARRRRPRSASPAPLRAAHRGEQLGPVGAGRVVRPAQVAGHAARAPRDRPAAAPGSRQHAPRSRPAPGPAPGPRGRRRTARGSSPSVGSSGWYGTPATSASISASRCRSNDSVESTYGATVAAGLRGEPQHQRVRVGRALLGHDVPQHAGVQRADRGAAAERRVGAGPRVADRDQPGHHRDASPRTSCRCRSSMPAITEIPVIGSASIQPAVAG